MTKNKVLGILTSVVCAASALVGSATLTASAAPLYSSEMTSGNLLYKEVDENYDGTYDYVEITGWTSISGEKVETLTIPTVIDNLSVQSIQDNVFSDNTDLYEINVNPSNEYFTAVNGVLFNKDQTRLICYPAGRQVTTSYDIPSGVEIVGTGAFSNCSVLAEVTIPISVKTIGAAAFYYCSALKDIDIPSTVTSVGWNAFYGTAMLNYQMSNEGPLYYADTWVIDCESDIETIIDGSTPIKSGTTGIADYTFSGCSSLSNVAIPSTVKYVGAYAFSGCSNLAIITIPSSVVSIGDHAFYSCSRLTTVKIPDSVKTMGDYAFKSCTQLSEITLSNNLSAIGNNAFEGCRLLTAVDIPTSVKSIGDKAFYDCSGLNTVTIRNASCDIYNSGNTFNKTSLTIVGYAGSTAATYAAKYNKTFVQISGGSGSLIGDADGNGKVSASDAAYIARLIAQASLKGDKVSVEDYPNADYDQNGKITASDAAAIAKWVAEQALK